MASQIGNTQVYYGPNNCFIKLNQLNAQACKTLELFALQLASNASIELFNNVIFELRWPDDD